MRLSEFLANSGRPVAYYPKLCPMLGGVTPTLFFCQFFYWLGKESSPDGSIYKTMEEITEETGLTRKEQETARKYLRQLGLLTERYARLDHRMYYTLHLDVLDTLWDHPENWPTRKRKTPLPNLVLDIRHEQNGHSSSAETTPEITSRDYQKHKGGLATEKRDRQTTHGVEQTGYFLKGEEIPPLNNDFVPMALDYYYRAYKALFHEKHPRLKTSQLKTIYGALDEAFTLSNVTSYSEATEFVRRHFERNFQGYGNVNLFACYGVLRHIAYELGITSGYEADQ